MQQNKRIFIILILISILLTSCATLQRDINPEDALAGLDCIEYKDDMLWKNVSERFGSPSIVPLPASGTDLSKYIRGYEDKVVIFHTERKEFMDEGKKRFYEVITKIEVCKER